MVEGGFWDSSTTPARCRSSGHAGAGLRLGDRIRFDILGRTITARVTSVREVDWDDPREGGFIFVLPARPAGRRRTATWDRPRPVGRPPSGPGCSGTWSPRYPNVSVIDVREVIATIQRIVSLAALGIRSSATVALVCGLTILVGAVAMTKFQRLREVALLKTSVPARGRSARCWPSSTPGWA